ncbi:MAG: PEP-CTERM sorting domain-containing protein [Cyanobacteria bacterium P01_G01_bin.54]
MMSKTQFTGLSVATALLSLAAPVNANEILFTFVQDNGGYVNDGRELASYIDALTGFNVTQRVLDDAIYDDYDDFDQIWVYDLEVGANNNTTQAANYAGIANWFNNRKQQNLITDGRIISSGRRWTNRNRMSSETPWIQNYALQLASRGGGLVLGTDHASPGQPSGVFVDGINEINAMIGINPFHSFFGSSPYQASVDAQSPLAVASLDHCRAGGGSCINDNSSTSFAPAGEQPSGLFLTPVAYHGTTSTAFENAAVSSTIGSPTFTTVPEPSTVLSSLAIAAVGFFSKKKKN